MAGGGAEEVPWSFTPTWVVAAVSTVIIAVSLFFERGIHYVGKNLLKRNNKPLFDALQKVKEELMLLGFISLLLSVTQDWIQKICIPKNMTPNMFPCKKKGYVSSTIHRQVEFFSGYGGSGRRHLAGGGGSYHCAKKGKVPAMSLGALHQLHIFIFVLAAVHIFFCAITVLMGKTRMNRWKSWEDSCQRERLEVGTISDVQQNAFVKRHYKGFGKGNRPRSWVFSFVKQFTGSIKEIDYTILRRSFIMTHCASIPTFDFHKYMIRVLDSDFKKVVGISWYLWIFVIVFLLLNVDGWHTYIWTGIIPLILLFAVGTKLEHVVIKLAHGVAEKHTAIDGVFVVKPSNRYFWFGKPKFLLYLIQFIIFQNAFEVAFFFWIWINFGSDSCTMNPLWYLIPRLLIAVIIVIIVGHSTLPLYSLITEMSEDIKEIINEQSQMTQIESAAIVQPQGVSNSSNNTSIDELQMQELGRNQNPNVENGNVGH